MKKTIYNAQSIIYHWVSCSWRILLLLFMFDVQCSMFNELYAQTTQDALYVFRNDGKFNFFFYGELNHIEYSRVDTFGIEQDDYVVQEFYTRDTVYRIPISAIDSVSFVTPETKLKKNVKVGNDLRGYVQASDGEWYIVINTSYMPPEYKEEIPQVGDLFLIEMPDNWYHPHIPHGFGGKVIVSQYDPDIGGGGWLVVTEPTPITDMYDQIVIKGAGQSNGASLSREWKERDKMNVTGLDGITIDVPEQTFSMPVLSTSFNVTHSLFSTPFESPISISGDLTGYGQYTISPGLTYRGCLFVSPFTGVQFDQRTVWDLEKLYSLSLEGTLNGRIEVGLGNSREVKIGPFKIKMGAGLFIETSMTGFSFSLFDKTKTHTVSHMSINESNPTALSLKSLSAHSRTESVPVSTDFHNFKMPTIQNTLLLPSKMSIGMGVYASAETRLALPLDKTTSMPEFLQKYLSGHADKEGKIGFDASLGFDIGVKCDIECPWALLCKQPSNAQELLQTQNSYKQVKDNGSVQLTGYAKATAEISLGKWKVGSPHEASYPLEPRYFAPDISGVSVSVDPDEDPRKPYIMRFTSPISRKLFLGARIGFAVFDENNEIVETQSDLGWSGPELFDAGIKYFQKPNYYNTFKLDPGKGKPVKYTIYPLVAYYGTEGQMLVDKSKTFTLEAARFDISKRTINVSDKGGYIGNEYVGFYEVEVVPNMENVEVETKTNWINTLNWTGSQNELSFHWEDLPDGMKSRRGVIHLIGKSKKGEVLVEDSIVVIQSGPYMVLEPEKLTFPKEGGTKTVTIKETNLTNLRLQIPASSPEIKGTLTGNVVLITMPANTGAKRGNQVRIVGKYIDGTEAFAAFEVEQEGNGTDPDPDPDPNPSDFVIEEISLDKYLFGESIYPEAEAGKIFSFSDWETKTDDEGFAEYGAWWNVNDKNTKISISKNNAGGYTISALKTVDDDGSNSQGGSNATTREITFDVAVLEWERNESDQTYHITAKGLTNLKASEKVNQYGYTSTEIFEIASLPDLSYGWQGYTAASFGGDDVPVASFSFKSIADGITQQEMTTYNGYLNVGGTDVPNHCYVTIKFKKKQ